MKRILSLLLICFAVLLSSGATDSLASPLPAAMPMAESFGWRTLFNGSQGNPKDVIEKLRSDVMPQFEEILTPAQLERFETSLSEGESFRKTFKTLMLTPEQKGRLKGVLSSVPQRSVFASLTPTEKKSLFLKKKEAFMPTSEEIKEKIRASKEAAGEELSAEVEDKIDAGLEARDSFVPSAETILDKIKAGIEAGAEAVNETLEN